MGRDWMPHTKPEQLVMAKRWIDVLLDRKDDWDIPESLLRPLVELTGKANYLLDKSNSLMGTRIDAASARAAFQELVAHMRYIRRRTFFMPPLTESNFVELGLRPPDTIRTSHMVVSEKVDFVIHLSNIRQLVVDFWVQGETRKAKPRGYDGAVIIWDIRDTPPEQPTDLANHTMASRRPYTLTFDETQRGKTVQIALAWQNERGILGQWSEYKSAIIP